MSVFIGSVRWPHHNSPHVAAEVWCSATDAGVELNLFDGTGSSPSREGVHRSLDPIAARNLAALLVRASEEAERMRARPSEPEPR